MLCVAHLCDDVACGERLASALEMASASAHMDDAMDSIDLSIIDAASVRQFGNLQKEMLMKWAWNEGGWCDRAWLPNKGFVGSSQRGDPLGITLEPQPWVLMARVLNESDQITLVANVQERLQTEIGYKQAFSASLAAFAVASHSAASFAPASRPHFNPRAATF